jgi:hypothetical protein
VVKGGDVVVSGATVVVQCATSSWS